MSRRAGWLSCSSSTGAPSTPTWCAFRAISQLAEEITQETFLKVYQAREQLPGIENPRAWIFRIATNTCLTVLKRNRRFRWLPWEAAENLQGQGRDEPGQVGQRDAVERALASLSQEYRAPLLLFSYHGFRVAEIAEVLGISEGRGEDACISGQGDVLAGLSKRVREE